ncbi:hypothetical protein DL98DRAFT_72351 [Cadophora sp. DSE1049]|nr:hypothetical protein DL98DRAFT_72351 [Cadophora sp. DSE1049]
MAPCFRCRLRKLTCSEETFCKQRKLAGFKCKYRMHRSKSTLQDQRQTKSALSADTLSYSSYEDEPSNTETIDSHDQCDPPTLQYLGDNIIYTSIERPVEQKQIHGASNPSPRLVLSNPDVGDGVVFEFSINGQRVEYLFEPTDQQFLGPTSSNTTWQFIIGAKLCELLINLPLGSPAISTIGAPFFDNQYAGDELGFLEVSWQKSFLVARKNRSAAERRTSRYENVFAQAYRRTGGWPPRRGAEGSRIATVYNFKQLVVRSGLGRPTKLTSPSTQANKSQTLSKSSANGTTTRPS